MSLGGRIMNAAARWGSYPSTRMIIQGVYLEVSPKPPHPGNLNVPMSRFIRRCGPLKRKFRKV